MKYIGETEIIDTLKKHGLATNSRFLTDWLQQGLIETSNHSRGGRGVKRIYEKDTIWQIVASRHIMNKYGIKRKFIALARKIALGEIKSDDKVLSALAAEWKDKTVR